jgi:hypothetical protein
MRMRPLKPLPPTLDELKAGPDGGKRKKRISVPIRARRKTIDVTRWGGERLSGVFLQSRVVPAYAPKPIVPNVLPPARAVEEPLEETADVATEDEEDEIEVENVLTTQRTDSKR